MTVSATVHAKKDDVTSQFDPRNTSWSIATLKDEDFAIDGGYFTTWEFDKNNGVKDSNNAWQNGTWEYIQNANNAIRLHIKIAGFFVIHDVIFLTDNWLVAVVHDEHGKDALLRVGKRK